MIICKKCESVLPNKAKYCKECGETVPDNIKFCDNCHSDITEDAKYCGDCGHKIKEDNTKPISAFLLFLIFIGALLVIYRSVDLPFQQNLNQDNASEQSRNSYEEVSFNTLVFKGTPRNEIRLNVETPTTQALIMDSAKEWITENIASSRINGSDETIIEIYELDSAKNVESLRAKIVRINLEENSNYIFPDGDFQSIGENMFILWVSKDNSL